MYIIIVSKSPPCAPVFSLVYYTVPPRRQNKKSKDDMDII